MQAYEFRDFPLAVSTSAPTKWGLRLLFNCTTAKFVGQMKAQVYTLHTYWSKWHAQ